jgi:hypothetical protein
MASIINASSTGAGGIIQTADASGVLQLQSNGVTALSTSGANVTVAGTLTAAAQSIAKASLPTGSVLQVVGGTTVVAVSTTGTSYVASNVAATITPTSATSKIFILATFWQNSSAITCTNATTIYRNATDLAAAYGLGMGAQYLAAGGGETNGALSFLDSPATTSATTYTVYFKRADSAGTVAVGSNSRISSITLMEIAA